VPQVLTTGATISCAHSGTVELSSDSKLKVSGVQVLLQNGLGKIDGCKQPTGQGTAPDLNASASATLSQKLMSDGNPVMVTPLVGIGDGSPQPSPLTAGESQSKLAAS